MLEQQIEAAVVVEVEEPEPFVEAERQAERGAAIDEARDAAGDALVEIEVAGGVEVEIAVAVEVDGLGALALVLERPAAVGDAGRSATSVKRPWPSFSSR